MDKDIEEKYIASTRKYTGNIIDLDLVTVALPNGKIVTRDVVIHPGAAVVLPMTESGELYMVKQYRTPAGKALLEFPAGKLDAGEDPLNCAQRELLEETGLKAKEIRHLISFYTTPGFSNELLHLYVATGLTQGEAALDVDEFLSVEKYPLEELMQRVFRKEIQDAKTIMGIFFAEKVFRKDM